MAEAQLSHPVDALDVSMRGVTCAPCSDRAEEASGIRSDGVPPLTLGLRSLGGLIEAGRKTSPTSYIAEGTA